MGREALKGTARLLAGKTRIEDYRVGMGRALLYTNAEPMEPVPRHTGCQQHKVGA